METVHDWRELLATLIEQPQAKQRLAEAIGVTPLTLQRWMEGFSEPRLQNLLALYYHAPPQYQAQFSTLLSEQFPEFAQAVLSEQALLSTEPPSALYAEVLRMRSTGAGPSKKWTMCERALEELVEQLEHSETGIAALIAVCTVPAHPGQPVRSLQVLTGKTHPASWGKELREQPPYLFGAESLSGYVLQVGHLVSLEDMDRPQLPALAAPGLRSALACPIRLGHSVAGSLYVASRLRTYFTHSHHVLVERYADLVATAFEERDFYAGERIHLGFFPDQRQQRAVVTTFQQRVRDLLLSSTKINAYSLTLLEAEQIVWRQLEDELLQPNNSERDERPQESCP